MLKSGLNSTENFKQSNCRSFSAFLSAVLLLSGLMVFSSIPSVAQGPVNGGFEGRVSDVDTKIALPGAIIQFTNSTNGFQTAKKSDVTGYFRQDTLQPGIYVIKITLDGYETQQITQQLYATRSNTVVPIPVFLKKATSINSPGSVFGSGEISDIETGGILNPRRDEAFGARQVSTLPLGGVTLTRTFDELGFFAPGVAPPPQAIGNSVGPGIGGGVGTSGQFSVNGLRSRANNFTVDGSDNNDEDIGVRRQGFFSLVPQPIESIQEFQIVTLLAPAQYGRNLGAQVNALSKSGGNDFHGSIFALFNSSRLNARNFFDYAGGNYSSNLQGVQSNGTVVPVFIDGQQKNVFNSSGEKDSMTLFHGGFAGGGRIVRDKMFFFVSGEGQILNGSKETHFIVPTVEQRGLFNLGAEGVRQCKGGIVVGGNCFAGAASRLFLPGYAVSDDGNAVFSLFPFANDPNGIYGRNTYTQSLSTNARGRILSGKYDWNIFKINGYQQTFTARYNQTADRRDLTDVGGALFSAIRPKVRTDNFSTYISGSLTNNASNEFRFSFGRTDLKFDELRDTTGFILPVSGFSTNPDAARFLLNARILANNSIPSFCTTLGGCRLPSQATYVTSSQTTAQTGLGPIGQLIVPGFSPVGVDVNNFPQERVNNTYQFADTFRWQTGNHSLSLGTDIRRTSLASDLPRNSRPLVTFAGGRCDSTRLNGCLSNFASPLDLAAAGAATGFFQTLVLPSNDSQIKLNYYQLNFFAQDEWRVTRNFSLSYGLRYEYNTPPEEADSKIEQTFNLQQSQFPNPATSRGINLFQGFSDFVGGRSRIFDADRNNFAPRIGAAWSPDTDTVIRAGYGLYYDQIIGAVVSQSRNVFPTFTNINTGGGLLQCANSYFYLLNPITNTTNPPDCKFSDLRIVQSGTLNTLNPEFDRLSLLTALLRGFPSQTGTPIGTTLPAENLPMPFSQQYSIGIERKLFGDNFVSVAYVGTRGRNLLRFTTPNLGNNYVATLFGFELCNALNPRGCGKISTPQVTGITADPARPNANIGVINQYETTGRSRYDSLQIEMRGRLSRSLQYQAAYVFGKVEDDVSDVFDLAGAYALPQNSRTFAGEYAPANFDVRHRFTYSFVYDLPQFADSNAAVKTFLGDWQIAGTGAFNTGQPFTVNTYFDVNLDGNLTDRLNSTQFLTVTEDRRQPLALAANANLTAMLAPFGQDGAIPRNSFRAGNLLDLNLSLIKRFNVREGQTLQLRADVFNFINRANFGVPVRILESPNFGQSTDTITPSRRIQIVLKYIF